jgi:hypothetical protein
LYGSPAVIAEPGSWRKVSATGAAGESQTPPALQAETRLRRIVVLAPRTLHVGASGPQGKDTQG